MKSRNDTAGALPAPLLDRLIAYARILFGLAYVINGVNWFTKIISPYPSISDFIHFMPTNDLVGAMIERSYLFHVGKGIEVIAGILLLTNRLVPLALVAAMPVTLTVFMIDVLKPEIKLRSTLMGTGSLTLNTTLLLAYLHHYLPMLNWRAQASAHPASTPVATPDAGAAWLAEVVQKILAPLVWLAVALGTAMVIWLAALMADYAMHHRGLSEIRHLEPRVATR